jgi:glycosyltransferase involved in cell wall biosynthesis
LFGKNLIKNKILIVTECFYPEEFNFSDDDKKHFTFAGNIGTVQNLNNVIIAFATLNDSYLNNAQLNIIGDGSELEKLRELVKINNYQNIVFHGRKPRDEMCKYFNSSDFLIVSLVDKPIFSLTVPAKIQTYIASNKPILAMLNGDAANIIKENNLGYCAKPNNIEEIQNIFIKAIDSDTQEVENFTQNCEILTSTIFNKKIIIDKLLRLTIRYYRC